MDDLSNKLMDLLRPRISQAMHDFSERQVAITQAAMSSRRFPPSGTPDSYPAFRTRQLYGGMGHSQQQTDSAVVETISSTRGVGASEVPAAVEFGREGVAPRPYMGLTISRIRETGLSEIANALRPLFV